MNPFFDLFVRRATDQAAWNDPGWADRQLPDLVEQAPPLRLWKPGDAVSEQGMRVLIGIATWSGYDLWLLDVIAEGVRRGGNAVSAIDLFNVADCQDQSDYRHYIPKLRKVLQTPVAGIWVSGRSNWSGQGHEARDRVAKLFGSSSAEITAGVTNWINQQRPRPPQGASFAS